METQKNVLTIKEFKDFVKNKMTCIEDLNMEIYDTDKCNNFYIDYEYNQDKIIKINFEKVYYDKKLTNGRVISFLYLETLNSNKYWELFKKKNIKLNYDFIYYIMVESYNLKAIKWFIKNPDYINQWLSIKHKCDDNYYRPRKVEEFIYNALRNNDLHIVELIAKTNFDVHENKLLERMIIEISTDTDWDIAHFFNLIALNSSFDWDKIDPLMRIEILWEVVKDWDSIDEAKIRYPNIFRNKKIKQYLNGKYPKEDYEITIEKCINYDNMYYLYADRTYILYTEEQVTKMILKDSNINNPIIKKIYNDNIIEFKNKLKYITTNNISIE